MSEHHATITWVRESAGFNYEEYNRDHEWRFDGGVTVAASAAPRYLGTEDRVDPEEALVAAISSCHMLTFLAICARRRIVVDEYVDEAVGQLEKNDSGRLAVTKVELRPRIRFGGEPPGDEELERIHEQSHRDCFIANSVTTQIVLARYS